MSLRLDSASAMHVTLPSSHLVISLSQLRTRLVGVTTTTRRAVGRFSTPWRRSV